MELNPLSHPKGTKYSCELCGKTAYLQCKYCRVTYYCSKEHQGIDWNGIHAKICQLLMPLRTQPSSLGSEEDRMRRKKLERINQSSLMDLTRQEALKLLHEGHFDLAIPAALQSLRFSIDYFGQNSIDLVPSYLLLGEACVGLSRYKQAEEYLSLAKWAVLKQPNCSNSLKSNLYRNFGKLYGSQGKYKDALYQLANDVYFSSLDNGPEHIATVGGYFYMGNVFMQQDNSSAALAMYSKVALIWFKALSGTPEQPRNIKLDEAQQTECQQMMLKILAAREIAFQQYKETMGTTSEHDNADNTRYITHRALALADIGEACFTLGMIHFDMRLFVRARDYAHRGAGALSEALGPDHPSSLLSLSFLRECTPYANAASSSPSSPSPSSPSPPPVDPSVQ